MSVEATERWSGQGARWNVDLSQWTARREFDVAYASSATEAKSAVAAQFNVFPGGPHNETSVLTCADIGAARPDGFAVWRVTADYAVLSGVVATSDDPLKQPMQVSWQPALQSAVQEYGPSGGPIVNACGQPYEPAPQMDVSTMTLEVVRNEPFFSPQKATTYMDTVNSDSFSVKGKVMNTAIKPGQAKCKFIGPAGAYTLGASYVTIKYVFEFRRGYLDDVGGFSDAWQERRANVGTLGWYRRSTDGAAVQAPFYNPDGQQVSQPVYLDPIGIPLDDTIRVGQGLNLPIHSPSLIADNPDVTVHRVPAPGVKGDFIYLLYFQKYPAVPFTGLL